MHGWHLPRPQREREGTTHLLASTVVRVKGTPLSSSTMKIRWQKGQWPTLSPSSLACGQRESSAAPLPQGGCSGGSAGWAVPVGAGEGGGCVALPWPSPGWPQASRQCWPPVAPATLGRVPGPSPCLLRGLHTPWQSSPRGTAGAGPGTPGRPGGHRLPQPHSAKGART